MKKFFPLAAALLAVGTLQAFEQSSYAPGVMISSVPGAKLTNDSFLKASPGKIQSGIVELNGAKELVFRPEPGKKEAELRVFLPLPALARKGDERLFLIFLFVLANVLKPANYDRKPVCGVINVGPESDAPNRLARLNFFSNKIPRTV